MGYGVRRLGDADPPGTLGDVPVHAVVQAQQVGPGVGPNRQLGLVGQPKAPIP